MPAGERIAVARVARIFGREGEVDLTLYDTFPNHYDMSEPLFVRIDGLAVPLFFDRFRRRGRGGATAVFADIDTERRASELIGLELFLSSEALAETHEAADEGEIFPEDLNGFSASLDNKTEGRIEAFIDGDNPLFRIDVEGREVLVPAVDAFIREIDEDARVVTFTLPDGLLELYSE